jgi:hypothetical protein
MVRKDEIDFYSFSKFDLALVMLVLFFSGFLVFRTACNRARQSARPGKAEIYQASRMLESADLRKDSAFSILNGKMRIKVEDGKIRVIDADCPQHLCVNMGGIEYSGQSIVCVPNKVLIEIKSAGPQFVDAVAN